MVFETNEEREHFLEPGRPNSQSHQIYLFFEEGTWWSIVPRSSYKQERFWLKEIKLPLLHWVGGSFYETAVNNEASFNTFHDVENLTLFNDFFKKWFCCITPFLNELTLLQWSFLFKINREKYYQGFYITKQPPFFSCRCQNLSFSWRNKLFNHENWMAVR